MPADAFKFTNWTTNLPTALSDALNGEFTDGVIVLTSAGIQINSVTQPWPTFAAPTVSLFTMANSVVADISITAANTYYDGPIVAQGSVGTWLALGQVTVLDVGGPTIVFSAKLWDGTTVIDSAQGCTGNGVNAPLPIALSGVITSPAGNLRISCESISTTTGKIKANGSGNGKDSTITAIRIA